MKKVITPVLLSLAMWITANAETVLMENGTHTLSAGTSDEFYDAGGASNEYSNNESYTLTVLPATKGEYVKVSFTSIITENIYDILEVYDGTSTSDKLIASYAGTFSGTINIIATNEDGALTFCFNSDEGNKKAGWKATLSSGAHIQHTLSFNTEHGTAPAAKKVSDGGIIGELLHLTSNTLGYEHTGWRIGDKVISSASHYTYGKDTTATAIWEAGIAMQTKEISLKPDTCYAFYDSGMSAGNYTENEGHTLTVRAATGNHPVSVTISSFDVASDYDYLVIYDGTSTFSKEVAVYDNNFVDPKTITATNADGALTFYFESNDNSNASGWKGTLSSTTHYTISVNLDGGAYIGTDTIPTTYTTLSPTIKLPNTPSKNDYTFAGWQDGNGDAITEITQGSIGNISLTAQWTQDIETTIASAQATSPFTQKGDMLVFDKATHILIFNAAGQMIYTGTTSHYKLPNAGMYIVKIGKANFQVMNL